MKKILLFLGLLIYLILFLRTPDTFVLFQTNDTPTENTNQKYSVQNYHELTDFGLSFKLPKTLSAVGQLVEKRISGETGFQYCLELTARNQSWLLTPTAYAGGSPCDTKLLTFGTTSKDYSAGRDYGFLDMSGYVKKGDDFLFVSSQKISSIVYPNKMEEYTNPNGVTMLVVFGSDFSSDPESHWPILSPANRRGVMINCPKTAKYTGIGIEMVLDDTRKESDFQELIDSIAYL